MKMLYEPEVIFKTKEEVIKWLDNKEYNKNKYDNINALMNYTMSIESGYNEYESRLMYDYFVRTDENFDVPVLNYLYGNTFVMYNLREECFIVDCCGGREYGVFKFSVPSYLIANANNKQDVVKWFNTVNKVYNFMRNDFNLREDVKEFDKLINESNKEHLPVLTAEIYNKMKEYFNSRWIEDENDTIKGYKLFEMIIDNLMTYWNMSLDETLFQECKWLFEKHKQNLEFFED